MSLDMKIFAKIRQHLHLQPHSSKRIKNAFTWRDEGKDPAAPGRYAGQRLCVYIEPAFLYQRQNLRCKRIF